MEVERVVYNRVCRERPYSPELLYDAVNEAINVFEKRNRYRVAYNDSHPITLADLREINLYIKDIWGNLEIYVPVLKEKDNVIQQ